MRSQALGGRGIMDDARRLANAMRGTPRMDISPYLALPGLRGLWTMGSVAYTNPQALDVSGNGNHLTNTAVSTFGYDGLVPYVEFNGTTQYLTKADGGAGNWADILGTEAYIVAGDRGLTLGGWFKPGSLDAIAQGLITKGTAAAATSAYELYISGTSDLVTFRVSTGAAYITIQSTAVITTTAWTFLVGRYIPSLTTDLFKSAGTILDRTLQPVGVPAALPDVAAAFQVGAFSGTLPYDGRGSICFLCAAAASDDIVSSLFESTKNAYQ